MLNPKPLNLCATRYGWGVQHIRRGTHMNVACRAYECGMSHIWMSRATFLVHMRDMPHYECGMQNTRISPVISMNQACHTCEWVLAHIWMRHIMRMNRACHTQKYVACHAYGCVMSRIWTRLVTHINESCNACEWGMSRIRMSPVTLL